MRRWVVLLFVLVSVSWHARHAHAQADGCGKGEDPSNPVALFEQGAACFKQGRFAEALARFKRAHALDPDPTLLYNIARAHEGLEDDAAALDAYERYLEARPDAEDRGAVEKRIAQLRRQLKPTPASPKPPTEPVDAPEPSTGPAIAPWIIAGAGVAALGVGVAFGVVAKSTEDDATAESDAFTAANLVDDAEQSALVANITLIGGAVLATAGVIWIAVDLTTNDGPEVGISPRGLFLRGAF